MKRIKRFIKVYYCFFNFPSLMPDIWSHLNIQGLWGTFRPLLYQQFYPLNVAFQAAIQFFVIVRLKILIFLKFSRNNFSILTVLKPLLGSFESTQQQQINLSLKLKGRETTNNYNALPKLNLLGEIEQKSPNLIQIKPLLPVTYNMIKLIYILYVLDARRTTPIYLFTELKLSRKH